MYRIEEELILRTGLTSGLLLFIKLRFPEKRLPFVLEYSLLKGGSAMQNIINYISDNQSTILVIIIALLAGSLLWRVTKRVASIILSVAVLLFTLSLFGVTGNDIRYVVQTGWSIGQNMFQETKDFFNGMQDGDGAIHSELDLPASSKPIEISTEPGSEAVVHFINVGQADSTLIQNGEDTILVDCGNRDDAALVIEYLNGLGIEQIDYFVATHPHEDHIGCAGEILTNFEVDTLLKPDVENDTACYRNMMEAAEKNNVNIVYPEAGETFQLTQSSFQVLGPIEIDKEDLNNDSIVLRYDFGETSFLLAGDAERESEHAILDAGFNVAADVLKVGHHGSSTSTSYPWLREIMPQYAVIMCGKDNSYGHPHDETTSKLRDAEVELYRTDKNGTIIFISDGEDLRVETEF